VASKKEVRRFKRLTYIDAMRMDLPPEPPQLVDGLVEAGTLGTIAGLPETGKTYLAFSIAARVAGAGGHVLGRRVLKAGPVGYVRQEDSAVKSWFRVNAYETANRFGDLDMFCFFNEGFVLPDDMGLLRTEVRELGLVLLVLDPFAYVAPNIPWKEEEAGRVFARLKLEICDAYDCTVLVVDHASWASQEGGGPSRGYGSVMKAGVDRFGLFTSQSRGTLFVEAHGNDITGLERTRVAVDPNTWELVPATRDEEIVLHIQAFVRANPEATKTACADALRYRKEDVLRLYEQACKAL
jgi:hypothetical protein